MSEFEMNEAVELNLNEMNEAAGGANRYMPLTEKAGFRIYKVQKGDTLIRIASRYHCSVSDILAWNPKITDKNRIYINEFLYLRP